MSDTLFSTEYLHELELETVLKEMRQIVKLLPTMSDPKEALRIYMHKVGWVQEKFGYGKINMPLLPNKLIPSSEVKPGMYVISGDEKHANLVSKVERTLNNDLTWTTRIECELFEEYGLRAIWSPDKFETKQLILDGVVNG